MNEFRSTINRSKVDLLSNGMLIAIGLITGREGTSVGTAESVLSLQESRSWLQEIIELATDF